MPRPPLLRQAVETIYNRYVALGWTVMPIEWRGDAVEEHLRKKPLISWKNLQRSPATPEQRIEWARRWPRANVGIATGRLSNLVVIDIDDEGAAQALVAQFPLTAVARTGKGRHYYFRYPQDGAEVGNRARFSPGADCRGEGGYVIVPPSLHETGVEYTWERDPEMGVADLPQHLLALVRIGGLELAQGLLATNTTGFDVLAGVSEGGRNNAAAQFAGMLLKTNPEPMWPYLFGAMLLWNKRNTPPLLESELFTTFQSIAQSEAKRRTIDAMPTMTARELFFTEIPPIGYAVENLIVDGLTHLMGKMKRGKSFLINQIAICVAQGLPIFGPMTIAQMALPNRPGATVRGEVLLLGLEDSARRLRDRIQAIDPQFALNLSGAHAATNGSVYPNLEMRFEGVAAMDQGVEKIALWLESHRSARLVVIDTFRKFTMGIRSGGNAFAADYAMMQPLADLSHKYNVPIVVIDHAGKTKHKRKGSDPWDDIAGTLGAEAAADTTIYLDRDDNREHAILRVRGREIESYAIPIRQRRGGGGRWSVSTYDELKAEEANERVG